MTMTMTMTRPNFFLIYRRAALINEGLLTVNQLRFYHKETGCQEGRLPNSLLLKGRQFCLGNFKLLSHSHPALSSPASRGYVVKSQFVPYNPPADKLGQTFAMDLSDDDQSKLKTLAYQEIKTLFETNKVKYKSMGAKKRPDGSAAEVRLFKTPLTSLVEKDISLNRISPNFKVPAVFQKLLRHVYINGFNTEQAFNITGDPGKTELLKTDLEQNFYKLPSFNIQKRFGIHDVASALKTFLRELPDALFSTEKFPTLPFLGSMPFLDQIKALNLLILSMEPAHRDTLLLLLTVLQDLCRHESVTKLNEPALGKVFGPQIFHMPENISPDWQYINLTHYCSHTDAMIYYNAKLFLVPPHLHQKLRKENSGKFELPWKKKQTDNSPPTVIQVMKQVNITDKTTASMVVQDYLGHNEPFVGDDFLLTARGILLELMQEDEGTGLKFLYEVGGNIGERCLDPDTNIQELWRENPAAMWAVKQRIARADSH